MIKINYITILIVGFLLVTGACRKLENTIEIDLDPAPNELVVECYLEAGHPYRLLLTETKDYLETINICPFVRDAMVVITHNGIKDTLEEAFFGGAACSSIRPFLNLDSTRFFNYGSTTICPVDYDHEFILEVWDTLNNRYAKASTQFIKPTPVTTLKATFNNKNKAYAVLGCKDDPYTKDYYRMMIHRNALVKKTESNFIKYVAENTDFDQVMNDEGIFAGNDVLHVSDYNFDSGDLIIGTIYHIDKAYYDYLFTTRNAENANYSPFIEPSGLISNIEGGHGIFTFLSYTRDTIQLP